MLISIGDSTRRLESIEAAVNQLVLIMKGLSMKAQEAIEKLDAAIARQDEAYAEINALIADLRGEIAALRAELADGALDEVLVQRVETIESKAAALADIVQPAPPVEPVE